MNKLLICLCFLLSAPALRSSQERASCPFGVEIVEIDSFKDLNSSVLTIERNDVLRKDFRTKSECFRFCSHSITCAEAHFHSPSDSCHVIIAESARISKICNPRVVRNYSCTAVGDCSNLVKVCQSCGHVTRMKLFKEAFCRRHDLEPFNSSVFCDREQEKSPISCPFGHREQSYDWQTDIQSSFLNLTDIHSKLESISSRDQCLDYCRNRNSCSAAVYHLPSQSCYISTLTLHTLAKLCALNPLVQLNCFNNGDCTALEKICRNCGAPINAEGMALAVSCNGEGATYQEWCQMRDNFICVLNPIARRCPLWYKNGMSK